MAPSMERLGRYTNCIGSSVTGNCDLMCFMTSLFDALHDDGCQCNCAVVVEAGHCGFLLYGDDGSRLETGRDNSGGQRGIEDIG